MILQEEVSIDPKETAGSLHDKLMELGSYLVSKTVNLIEANKVTTTAQPDLKDIKTAYKLNKDNCRINWNTSTETIYNKVRGLNPYPAAWTVLYNDNEKINIKIYQVDTLKEDHKNKVGSIQASKKEVKVSVPDGYIILKTIQLPGKRKMDIKSLLNGYHFEKNAKMLSIP